MLKILGKTVVALALLLGGTLGAQAAVVESTETGALFNAVGEVSGTLRVNTRFTQLSVFVSGTYAAGNTLVLQRGVGSPGSGSFENVMTVTTGTANARVVTHWTTGPNPESYRLKMTATGTGDIVAHLTDHPVTAQTFVTNSAQIVMFDDFKGNNSASTTVLNASKYLTTDGDVQGGTLGARTADVQEGTVQMDAGAGGVTDGICLSLLAVGPFSALPTDPGMIVFETRLQAEQVDGLLYMTLQIQECAALDTVVALIDIDSGVVAQVDTSNADMIGIARQDEADDTDDWQAFSSLVDVEGNNALEVVLGVVGVATEYDTLRVEVDSAGNGYWYINDNLVHAEALAVTPGTRLVPSIFVGETAANGGAIEIHIDYFMWVAPRPAS